MWKLIEEAQIIQNNIIRAQLDMKKIRKHNTVNFTQQNEFLQMSSISQANQQNARECIEVIFEGRGLLIEKEQKWQSIRHKIQSTTNKKMSEQGIAKVIKSLGIQQSSAYCAQRCQQQPILVIHKTYQSQNKTDKTIIKHQKQNKIHFDAPISKENRTKNGKQNNNRKKNAYAQIHQRKKQFPSIR